MAALLALSRGSKDGYTMADILRYRLGETNPIVVATKTGVALQIGDLCYLDDTDGSTVKPVSSFPWTTDLATTQAAVVAKFLGVNEQRWDGVTAPTGNKDGTNRVATSGTYEFACAAGSTFQPGDLVGPDASGTVLLNQQVVKVSTKGAAIGRVERQVVSGSSVRVRIFSAKEGPLTN